MRCRHEIMERMRGIISSFPKYHRDMPKIARDTAAFRDGQGAKTLIAIPWRKGGEMPPPEKCQWPPIKAPILGGGELLRGEMGSWGEGLEGLCFGGVNGALAVKDLQAGFRSDLIRGPAR
jgi:hypothetical protein